MSIGLGIGNSIGGKISGGYDQAAQAYFTAVKNEGGSLTSLEKDLVNTWFVTERAAGRLSKYKAVYPFKGRNSAAAAINMVNPSTYDLAFPNFVAGDFATSGYLKPDGSTKYADMGVSYPEVVSSIDDIQLGWLFDETITGGFEVLMGNYRASDNAITTIQMNGATPQARMYAGAVADGVTAGNLTEDNLYVGSRTSSSRMDSYVDSLEGLPQTGARTVGFSDLNIAIFARNNNGTIGNHTQWASKLIFIAEGITAAEQDDVNESVKNLVVDTDAQAYIQEVFDQGGTLTLAQQAAVNNLVKSMKADGLWDGAIRLYPFMGGTIDAARIDLISLGQATNNNFVDADVNAKIGLTGDGSTKAITGTNLATELSSIFNYQIFDFVGTIDPDDNSYSWGGFSSSNQVSLRTPASGRYFYYSNLVSVLLSSPSNVMANGDSIITARYSTTDSKLYLNGEELTSSTTDVSSATTFGPDVALFAALQNGTGLSAYSTQEKLGWVAMENLNEEDALRFEKLYKAFIQQVQDGETYETDAAAYFQAVEDAGGTLTNNVKSEWDAFVSREVVAGRWSKIKRLYPYLGGVINSAVIDAITLNAATNNNFVDADVDATIGLTGDGSTKSIIESGDITNIITDDYNFAIGTFAKDPVGVTPSGQYYTQYYDGSNRIAIRRLFNSIGAYSGSVSTYFYDNTDITAESNWSFIMGQYTSSSRSILFNGTNVKTNTATSSNPATGFIGDPYKYDHYYFTYGGQSNGSFISQGMSETELIGFESSYKTFINNITA
jgi:hypothetical protein